MRLPGMLHGVVLHPPVPGAVPRVVDCGSPAAMPGVTIVRDGEFIGVTAADPVTAQRAITAIKADWDEPSPGPADRADHLRSHPAHAQHVISSLDARPAVAAWDNGRLTVWAGTSVPFAVRARLSNTLRISEASIRVIVPPAWGGFGGQHDDEAVEAARLSRHTFRPVMVQ